jgi:hypothetical protein
VCIQVKVYSTTSIKVDQRPIRNPPPPPTLGELRLINTNPTKCNRLRFLLFLIHLHIGFSGFSPPDPSNSTSRGDYKSAFALYERGDVLACFKPWPNPDPTHIPHIPHAASEMILSASKTVRDRERLE